MNAPGTMHASAMPLDEDQMRAIFRQAIAGARLAVDSRPGPASSVENELLSYLDGCEAAARAAGTRCARLGADVVLGEFEAGRDLRIDGPMPTLEAAVAAMLSEHASDHIGDLSALAVFEGSFSTEDATLLGVAPAALQALASSGWIRTCGERLWLKSRFVRRAVRRLDIQRRADAEATFAAWGAGQFEAAFWIGNASAIDQLNRHRSTFQSMVTRAASAGPPTAVARDALLAWGAATPLHVDPLPFVRVAANALASLAGRVEGPRVARLALLVAEMGRRAGRPALVTQAVAMAADAGAPTWRCDLVAARLAYNQSRLDPAAQTTRTAREAASRAGDAAAYAQATLALAHVERAREGFDEAKALSLRAAEAFEACKGQEGQHLAKLNLALCELTFGRTDDAMRWLDLTSNADPIAASYRCLVHEVAAQYDQAACAIDRALATPSSRFFHALWRVYRGRVLLARGQFEAAERTLTEARHDLDVAEAGPSLSTAIALQAVSAAARGHADGIGTLFAEARQRCVPAVGVRLHIVALLEATASFILATTPHQGRPMDLDAVRAEKARWRTSIARLAPAAATPASMHLWATASAARTLGDWAMGRVRTHHALELSTESRCAHLFCRPVDLGHRPVLWRLLSRLAADHGAPATDDALVAAIWPGERITPAAAKNRLRVAVSELRSTFGWRELVQRRQGRYILATPLAGPAEPEPTTLVRGMAPHRQ